MLRVSDLEFVLPPDRVATRPAEPRDSARLMVLSRSDPDHLEHRAVRDLPELLRAGDVLVRNETRVLPARLSGAKSGTGGMVGGLFLSEERRAEPGESACWRVLLTGARTREGARIDLHDPEGRPTGVTLTLLTRAEEGWIVEVEGAAPGEGAASVLERVGATPLPPYILAARRDAAATVADAADRAWYQTAYASPDRAGAVAAPTAGLHFTSDLLGRLDGRGVRSAPLTLHVGMGTFKPVETEFLEQHPMHEEWREVPLATLRRIAAARAAGGRIVAVGTTSVRALESIAPEEERVCEAGGAPGVIGPTRLLITPGFQLRRVDALLTNFHLPRSTLLALVAAFLEPSGGGGAPPGQGLARIKRTYASAIDAGYRFYSYGDAMLILP